MTPLVPPPPICAARRFHEAGSTTRNRMGLAETLRSIGAIEPSTAQCAGALPFAAIQRGGFSVTPETGSPIRGASIAVPAFALVQSISVIVRVDSALATCLPAAKEPGPPTNSPPMNRRTAIPTSQGPAPLISRLDPAVVP